MRFVLRTIGLLTILVMVAACGQAPASQPTAAPASQPMAAPVAGERIKVMASTSIVADVVRQVGGDRVEVDTIVPIGADVHNYEPTPQDLARVSAAQVMFIVGAGYEEFIERLIASSGASAEVVSLSDNLALRTMSDAEAKGHSHDEEHSDGDDHSHDEEHSDGDDHSHDEEHSHAAGSVDPHTWMNPEHVKAWVDVIASTLSRLDPMGANEYAARSSAYQRQLTELDAWIAEQFAVIPAERRLIVSDHVIFGYMADRYGLRQLGAIIPGVSTSASPSAQELATVQDLINEYQVPAIFVGDVANQQIAEQIARDTGARIVTVLTESLTDANGPGATYLDYMRFNVQTIVDALRS